ncbi:MAG: class II aldolase/adducin family protein [Bacteroidales bacterium]|jgi:L-fuculose-phosphate aldolase|nr:class II aldolase/adducin family protein [Bacteroidales bacterium]
MDTIINTKLMHPRDQIVAIISRIYERSLTTTSGGNISIIDENGDIWVTPGAVDKGSLQASDIMLVKRDGTVVGKHKPSSEYPFHKAIFASRPDIKAIIHAHPPALVSFSIIRNTPNPNVISQARHICGPIGYATYEVPGSRELGQRIGAEFVKGYKAVIMENHGTVVGGSDINDAFQRFETLEFCARTIIYGQMIGGVKYLDDRQIQEFEAQSMRMLPEMAHVEYPSDERQIRTEICRIVHRACRQGLMVSSYGTVSVRWQGNDFLITPTNFIRWNMELDDVVQIRDGHREPGKTPSRITWLHQEIYNRFPHINSIILTQPPYLMAFGASHCPLDVRTIPESWIFLQDVPLMPFGTQFRDKTEILDKLSEGKMPALMIENDSVLVTGDRLLQTFDRLEVAEFSAKSLVLASSVGQLQPINQQQIEDLRKVFLK